MAEKILIIFLLILICRFFFLLIVWTHSKLKEQNSTLDSMSAELEQVAIQRFRELTGRIVPNNCHLFRKIDDRVVTLYLDFIACPEVLSNIMKTHYGILTVASHKLGLADSLVFTISNQIQGWTNLTKNN